ncbi:MAG TPA: ferredoxin reductase family protein [Candidatus Kapabacteria bacterium]|nr:ferredoxin reductase family protein [Candidatus Kapabacteria bacterium]
MKKLVWNILLWANWAIIVLFWWNGASALFSAGFSSIVIAFGRLAGLVAAYMILLQFFFMGRTPWLERVFGLDRLSRIHQTNGRWGFLFLMLHPILLVWGNSIQSGVGPITQLMSFFTDYEHVALAMFGLLLFIIVVASSIYIVRRKLRYETWYFVHLLTYLAVFFSYRHQVEIGGTLLSSRLFYGYWILLYTLVFANHLLFRFVRPLYSSLSHQFRVSRIVRENYNTVSVYITGKRLHAFSIHPGQFMIVRFLTKGVWWQAHPFSLSFLPHGNELRITVKEVGDFTKQLAHIPIGTRLLIDGPYGVFTDFFCVSDKVLLIAGGIGITPIRSLVEQMAQKKKDVVLLYANKTQDDIVFKDELDAIAKRSNIRITHVLSDDPAFTGEKGRVDDEKIQRLVSDVSSRDVYLCGPVPMMDALVQSLQKLKVPLSRIHYEKFSF